MGKKNEMRAADPAPAAPQAQALCYELTGPLTALGHYLQAAQRTLEQAEIGDTRLADILAKALLQTNRAGDLLRDLRACLDGGGTNNSSSDDGPDTGDDGRARKCP